MEIRYLVMSVVIAGLVGPTGLAWAGAALGNPAVRESFLAHVCKGGPDHGQPCTVMWSGQDPFEVVTDDCPGGMCVIDYTSEPIPGRLFVIFDEDVTQQQDPDTILGQAVTILLCVKKGGQWPCFAETYQEPQPNPNCPPNSIVVGGFGCVREQELASFADADRETILLNWQFYAPEGIFGPESDLAQALRDAFQTTGIPVVANIGPDNTIQVDEHTGDMTATILRFSLTLRFVSEPSL